MVKLSPGVERAQVQTYLDDGARLTFVSVEGDLKEALPAGAMFRSALAVLLTKEATHVWSDHPAVESRISEPRGWLVEPDPAIIRAGLVANLALEIGGAQLDPEIAYITTDAKPETPWARAWRILDWMPFNLKKLRAYLRERGVGQVTVKKRGRRSRPKP
ncbi:MAG: hypothetical protein U0703_11260 [Anaerolineae bacterium]